MRLLRTLLKLQKRARTLLNFLKEGDNAIPILMSLEKDTVWNFHFGLPTAENSP